VGGEPSWKIPVGQVEDGVGFARIIVGMTSREAASMRQKVQSCRSVN
jgi:hypothetical protein